MTWTKRDKISIIIGSIYIITSITYLIIQSIAYVEYDKSDDEPERRELLKSEAFKSIITCSIVASVSALFIVGVVKRYRYLILPWFLLGIYIFYGSCVVMFWGFIGALKPSILLILLFIVIALLTFVIQLLIYSLSCSLYVQIYEETKRATSRRD